MFCPNCGNQCPDGTKFCQSCGTPLTNNQQQNTQPDFNNQQANYQQPNQYRQPMYNQPYQQYPQYARYCQGTKLNTQDTLKSISKEIGFFYFDLKSELSRQRLKFKSKDGN